MKSINRIITVCTVLLISFAVVTSLFFFLTHDVQAKNVPSVNVSGPIITNTTWTAANSPYILTGVVIVNEGVTLTVEPGVVVMANTNSGFDIAGRLEAIGTPAQPITFTSVANSAPGQWGGISIGAMGSAHLNHTVVQYAIWNVGVSSTDSAPTTKIENTLLQFSSIRAMYIRDHALHLVDLDNVTFANNTTNRIEIEVMSNSATLIDNATLTSQPGLEGYEVHFVNNNWGAFIVPAGITLTVEPNVTLFWDGFIVSGYLEAIGTPSQPITFTSVAHSAPGEWGGIYIDETGSAHLNHTIVQYGYVNIMIGSEVGAPSTKIENTVIQFSQYSGMSISDHALHLVDLDNVTFVNNGKNRIEIEASSNSASPIDNATLTFQPGLEGYEVAFMNPVRGDFVVPSGITLTMEPGVTFFTPKWSYFRIQGHLEAIGTPSQPITFTSITDSVPGGWEGIAVDEQGSAHLNHVVAEYGTFNIGAFTKDGAPVTKIENTIIQFGEYIGMVISDYSLHLVDLDNVMFNNNGKNRISIEPWSDSSSLIGNATLTTQPGLEGYEVGDYRADTFDIPQGLTLTVEPGVTLYMGGGFIDVNGRLQAIGTPTQPITFTSITTDTYPWQGIVVNGGSAELAHAAINRSQQNGLSILNGSVSAICSTLTNNLGSGIVVDENAQDAVMLAYNSLAGNTVAGLRHEGSGWLDARYTWWGAADGPSGMGAGSGDAVTGSVLYQPWLTEPACHDVESVNLEVTQSASSAVIAPAETLTYTITVTNHAATTATQVVLTDTLPANVTVLAAPATCIGITELVCALADLADGAQISFTIQIQANLTETAVLTNTIDVLAYQPDLDLSLNRSILTTIVQPEAPGWQIFLPFVIKSD